MASNNGRHDPAKKQVVIVFRLPCLRDKRDSSDMIHSPLVRLSEDSFG